MKPTIGQEAEQAKLTGSEHRGENIESKRKSGRQIERSTGSGSKGHSVLGIL